MLSNAPQRPLTVVMTADTVGGVWPYAVRLCASLPDTRFIVATMGRRAQQAQRDEIGALDNATLVESDYRLEWMSNGGNDFAQSRDWLAQLAAAYKADLVHVNGYAHACLDVDCPVLVVAHSDVFAWWSAVHNCAPPPKWNAYRERVMRGLAAGTRVVAPTAAVLNDLERHYRLDRRKATVISNGLDPAALPSLPKCPVIFAAGRFWDTAKNLAALDAVASGLAWPVEIAGDIEHPESGAAKVANARLLGRLSPAEMPEHLGRAAIFAAPARYEPFGLAILEAAAAGCALVLGDIPSLRENWEGAAVFVDPDDRLDLRSAINLLIANPEKRSRAAAAARSRSRRFTLARMAGAYAAVYRQIARESVRAEAV